MFSRVKHPCQRPPCYFAWGCFRYFSWEREPRRPCGCLSRDHLKGGLPGRSSRAAQPAFARWALAWQPSLRNGLPSRTDCELAEREGFEPPIGLHLCRISSAVHSTTLPPLQAIDVIRINQGVVTPETSKC